MIANYLLTAWRQLLKNKIYALINVLGLVVGLSVYIFGSLLIDYEKHYDTQFAKHERIFAIGSVFSDTANIGVNETDGIYSALGPKIAADVTEAEAVVRTVGSEFLVSVGDKHFYEDIRFTDPEFTTIFDFDYLAGDAGALADASGVILSRSQAVKLYGTAEAVGQTLLLDHETALHVAAVVEDLPQNTHLNGGIIGGAEFAMVAPLAALNKAVDYDLEGNFNNLSSGDMTYVLAPVGMSLQTLQQRIDGIYESHFPEDSRQFITQLKVRPLTHSNTAIWDAIGIPVLESVSLLAFLVLIVAIVNYTNLATAQSLGRAREVGLRKTLGAQPLQLLLQFLVESVFLVTLSMLISLGLIELIMPLFNEATGRELAIDYAATLPWLVATTLATGVVAGLYPAYLITQVSPIDAIREGKAKNSGRGGLFRSLMLGLQFTISIFMLAIVLVVYFQNRQVEESANIYPRDQVLTIQRMGLESIQDRMGTLRNEWLNVEGVRHVAYSSQLPYLQNNSSFGAGPVLGDEDQSFAMNQIYIDDHFLATYDIPVIAGRNFSEANSGDILEKDELATNVILNELGLRKLGINNNQAAIGTVFYDFPDEGERAPRSYTIVGVVPDQNFQGFHNEIKPTAFMYRPLSLRYASIRIDGVAMEGALRDVEQVWQRLVPDYPMQSEYLNETFQDVYKILQAFTQVLGGFAIVALALSLIGLFGLAAFMAQSRTREIGIRKVMGATLPQIVRLLIWQFSRPVIWSLLVALPLSYLASDMYLNFFAERIGLQIPIVAASGVIAVLFAWSIVAIHALRIARENPIRALRYE